MKSSKGISMITLIITIVVMIIILGIAYRAGTRYIGESREEERIALLSVMSTAIERRQNDNFIGLSGVTNYYSGYHVKTEEFDRLYNLFQTNDVAYAPGLWYMLDAVNANDLGVADTEKYLVSSLLHAGDEIDKYIALADYYTGKVFLLDYSEVKESINVENLTKPDGGNHTHKGTVATCTEPSVCTICGEIVTPALGHDYGFGENDKYKPNKMIHATCTEDLKCVNCGYVAEKATGHDFDTTSLGYDDEGHYHLCKNIDLNNGENCNGKGTFEKHDLEYTVINDSQWQHTVRCKVQGCNYGIDSTKKQPCDTHVVGKDRDKHSIQCELCLKSQDIQHDELIYKYIDKVKHMVHCNTCESDLYEVEHVDFAAPFGVCDLCDGLLDINQKPEIESLTMAKITSPDRDPGFAKIDDIIEVTLEANMMLSGTPKIEIQDLVIRQSDITNPESNKWVARIKLSDYNFDDGILTIEVSDIRSLWGVKADKLKETTDGKYIIYDKTPPQYYYLP